MTDVAIVSGAAGGLGAAFAQRLRDEGYSVLAFDTDPAVKDLTGVTAHVADVSSRADIESIMDAACALGTLRVVVNNAGAWKRTPVDSDWAQALADWDEIMNPNLLGVMLLSRAATPHLINAGGGHILNVSSYYVLPARSSGTNPPDTDLYNASKWALNGFTDAWAKRLAPHHIKVNGLCMGPVDTPMLRGLFADGKLPPPLAAVAMQPETIAEQMMEIIASGRSGENFGAWVGEPVDIGDVPEPHQRITGAPIE